MMRFYCENSRELWGPRKASTRLVSPAPSTGFKLDTYTNISAIINAQSPGGHYTGTDRLGTDNGRNSGSAVVDTNAKVYGMDNLVDLSKILILCFMILMRIYSTLSTLVHNGHYHGCRWGSGFQNTCSGLRVLLDWTNSDALVSESTLSLPAAMS